MRVVILGGGINGFSCAVRIQEHFQNRNIPIDVTVLSEEFTPNTTGDGSAGLWGPYLLGNTPAESVYKWSKGMHDFLQELWLSEDAGEAGVCLLPVIRLTTTDTPVADFWRDIVYGCQEIPPKLLEEYNANRVKKFKSGLHFLTYTSEPRKLLPYLMQRFQKRGGKIVKQKIESLKEFSESAEYDVVVNCTGLGSFKLLGDEKMYPVRGQVSRVRAPWMYYCLLDESDDGNYIIPNMDNVVLGGTHQENDFNISICPNDKKFITEGCHQIVPALANATHLFDWVGQRPGRPNIRLEPEHFDKKLVIHNYGHGGSGVTLAWGCAADVLDILEKSLANVHQQKAKL